MHVDRFGVGIKSGCHAVGVHVTGRKIARDNDVRSRVVTQRVVEDLYLIVGIDDDAGPCRNARHRGALGSEIRGVVLVDAVIEHPRADARLRQVRHVEHQYAARIARDLVVVHVGATRVFDFDAGNIEFDSIAANDDVRRLPNVNAGIRCAAHHAILDQHLARTNWIQTVSAVGGFGSTRPLDA